MTTDNKQIVQRALTTLITTGDVAALAAFLHDDFVHHRPDASSTKAQWLPAVQALPLAELRVDVHQLLGDGAHVVMHHSRRYLASSAQEIVGVDIWRIENGLVDRKHKREQRRDELQQHRSRSERIAAETESLVTHVARHCT